MYFFTIHVHINKPFMNEKYDDKPRRGYLKIRSQKKKIIITFYLFRKRRRNNNFLKSLSRTKKKFVNEKFGRANFASFSSLTHRRPSCFLFNALFINEYFDEIFALRLKQFLWRNECDLWRYISNLLSTSNN